MSSHPPNPGENALPAGLAEGQVVEAIQASGYPLQLVVADILRQRNLNVREEWSYIDRESGKLRALDLYAQEWLRDFAADQPRVTPELHLFIECKQSRLPYVFFKARQTVWLPGFPLITGLASDSMSVVTDGVRDSWSFSFAEALGLRNHSFFSPFAFSSTFTRVEQRSKSVTLSGSEIYNDVIMPLISALEHHRARELRIRAVAGKDRFYVANAVLAVALLDAPMLTADIHGGSPVVQMTPWVRVVRHEARTNVPEGHGPFADPSEFYGIDVVHRAFLETYLDSQVLPFADLLKERVMAHQEELLTGTGFAPGLANERPPDVGAVLRPISA